MLHYVQVFPGGKAGALGVGPVKRTLSSVKCPFFCLDQSRNAAGCCGGNNRQARPPQSPDRPPDVSTTLDANILELRSGTG